MIKRLSVRQWLNVVTLVLIVLVLFFARNDLLKAWDLLWQVNIWIFLLVIPVQFLSYYASGAIIFSYLKRQGDLTDLPMLEQPKMARELNFVNHIFPTAGVSGASYMTYRLGKLGINHGRATLAQVVRLAVTFASFAGLMLIALLWVTIDGSLTRFTILVAGTLVAVIFGGIGATIFLLGSTKRLDRFETGLDKILNETLVKWFGRKKPLVPRETMHTFFVDLHKDYLILRKDPKCLVGPFRWGIIFNIAEVSMYFVAFLSLGALVNPAPILIAIGLAGLAGAFLVTPGGAGGFEAAMILFLSSAGVPASISVAGVLLTRTVLILLTIVSGYVFYNAAMKKYGKPSS
jgi:uncharacterized protein (TIRG00374 family)